MVSSGWRVSKPLRANKGSARVDNFMLYMHNVWWFGGLLGSAVVFLLFIGLLVLVVRLAFGWTWYSRRRFSWGYNSEALETLRSRYARGELTREQYLEMKKTLEER